MCELAISIDDLSDEINRQLRLYANQTDETVQELAKEVAKEGVKMLKASSPKRYGNYAKSWTVTREKGKQIVHNKKHYRLTHLLEKGHAKVNGGRTEKFVHIEPAETKMINDFINGLERGLSE